MLQLTVQLYHFLAIAKLKRVKSGVGGSSLFLKGAEGSELQNQGKLANVA